MRLSFKVALAILALSPALARALPAPQAGMKRWIVTFKPTVKQQGRDQALAALKVKATAQIATDGNTDNEYSAAVVDLPAGTTLAKPQFAGAAAGGLDGIASIEPDQRVKWIEQAAVSFQATPFGAGFEGLKFPNAAFAVKQAKLANAANRGEITWGINRVHAPAAWDVTEGAGVKVAIIDTGIDLSHPDLAGKVDGGYSAITKTERPEDYQDDNGHGTHVSGTIAALRDGKGVVGVAPKARLYAVKVLDADGSGNLSDVIDGIVWAAKNGMQVANMSLGAPVDSDAMHRAVRYAKGMGMVIVAAAGNSGGSVGFPGAYPETIAVSASDSDDHIASFSSRGPEVKFIAPGVDIVSDKLGGGQISYNGTSMASPHVAGLAALAVSQGWTGLSGPDGVFNQLKKAAKPLPGLSTDEQGAGMIDAGKLVH
ncbi:MAG: S8 family peptidase [Elusimicrobia bacterium]|nr:S8 family peptidase [Elusimicrobiota bacterium]